MTGQADVSDEISVDGAGADPVGVEDPVAVDDGAGPSDLPDAGLPDDAIFWTLAGDPVSDEPSQEPVPGEDTPETAEPGDAPPADEGDGTVHVYAFPPPREVDLTSRADDYVLQGYTYRSRISGRSGDDTIHGADYQDTISGGKDDDRLYGVGGDDLLKGGDGDDRLSGGIGDDYVSGGMGDDRLFGAAGDDRLRGGAGHDLFRVDAAGRDVILDFRAAEDLLDFARTDLLGLEDVAAVAVERRGNLVLDFGDGDALVIRNATLADLTDANTRFATAHDALI